MKLVARDTYRFSTGREVRAHRGIIGLSPQLDVYGGYDGTIAHYGQELTPVERRELADYMRALWQSFAEKGAS